MELQSKDTEIKLLKTDLDRKVIYLQLRDIRSYENNAKLHTEKQIKDIRDSIIKAGYNDFIEVDENNIILSGHGRLKALYMIDPSGSRKIKVTVVDKLTEDEKKAYRIAANKLNMDTGFDNAILSKEFNTLEDTDSFNDTGFSSKEITEIWEEVNPQTAAEDNFEEQIESKYKIELGEVWQLGEHRLMCGDSTSKENVDKLINAVDIDLLFTDPPYGISIVNSGNSDISAKTGFGKVGTTGVVPAKTYKKVMGDEEFFDPTFLLDYGKNKIIWGANNFASKLPDNSQWLVWDKKCEKGADHNNFSDCELAWTDMDKKSIRVYRYLWSGLLREGKREVELKERVHPTQKPVGMLGDIIKDYSKENESVLDLFGGSGSTLIACEQLNRKCYMMELDPHYCSVIIERWEKLTNKQAIRLTE